jgi:hypothetical protein
MRTKTSTTLDASSARQAVAVQARSAVVTGAAQEGDAEPVPPLRRQQAGTGAALDDDRLPQQRAQRCCGQTG